MSKAILNKRRKNKELRSLIGLSRLSKYTVAMVKKRKTESNRCYREDAQLQHAAEAAKQVSHRYFTAARGPADAGR